MPTSANQAREKIAAFKNRSNPDIFDIVRKSLSPQFQARIPSATKASMATVTDTLFDPYNKNSSALVNEFVSGLFNQMVDMYINTLNWTSPLSEFKRRSLEYGGGSEELYIGLPVGKSRDELEESSEKQLLGVERPPMDVAYHLPNRDQQYKITVDNYNLRKGMLSPGGLADFVAEYSKRLYQAEQLDEMNMAYHAFTLYAKEGGFWREHVDALSADQPNQTTAQIMLTKLKAMVEKMCIKPQKYYNARHVDAVSRPQDLILWTTADVKACIDVMGLAPLMHFEKADTDTRIIIMADDNMEIGGGQAFITDSSFLYLQDYLRVSSNFYDPVGLRNQQYLTVQEHVGFSPFAQAALFWTGEGSKLTLVEPEGVSVDKPQLSANFDAYGNKITPDHVDRGGIVKLTAAMHATNEDKATWMPDSVKWRVMGDRELSPQTYITQDGDLKAGLDEVNTVLHVYAEATYINKLHPEVPAAASATLDVPVKGAAVVGFEPTTIKALNAPELDLSLAETPAGRITVLATTSTGGQVNVSNYAHYAQDDTSTAKVDSQGRVTAVKTGTATIHVTVYDKTLDATVKVSA